MPTRASRHTNVEITPPHQEPYRYVIAFIALRALVRTLRGYSEGRNPVAMSIKPTQKHIRICQILIKGKIRLAVFLGDS